MGVLFRLHRVQAKLITAACVILAAALFVGAAAQPPVRTAKQTALHEAAQLLREAGYAEDSAPIKALQAAWDQEQQDLSILAKVVDNEAPYCPWDHRVAVAAVVLNRTRDPRFPNTVKEVVGQRDVINGIVVYQYSPGYVCGFDGVRRSSYEAAAAAMNGEHSVPPDVVWQANFPQGVATWWISEVDTGWYRSTTYFCR